MHNRSTVAPTRRCFLVRAGSIALLSSLGTGGDRDGLAAIDWGVCGLPQTFAVSADRRIVRKHVGPVTRGDPHGTILPLIASLRRRHSGSVDPVDMPPAEAGRKP